MSLKTTTSLSLQPSVTQSPNKSNPHPNHVFSIFENIIIFLIITQIACIYPQLKLQSETVTIYNNPSTPTTIDQYTNFTFATTYVAAPICIYGFSQQTSVYNGTFYGRVHYQSSLTPLTHRFPFFLKYDDRYTSLLAKIIEVNYVCFENQYSNIIKIGGTFNPIPTGSTTLTQSYDFSAFSYTPSTEIERNIPVYSVTGYDLWNVTSGYHYSLKVQTENLTHLKYQLTLASTVNASFVSFYVHLFSLDGFPSGNSFIAFGTLELTAPFTQFNYDYVDGSDYVFGHIAQTKSDGTDLDIRFEENSAGGTLDITIGGLDLLGIGVFIYALDSQDRVKKFVAEYCTAKDADFVCTACDTGYELDANTLCVPAINGCKTLETSNHLLCDICHTGYVLSADQFSCDPNVANCDVMKSSTECQTCVVGHDLSADNLTCSPSVKDCVTMVPASATQCQTCDTGYTLSGDQLSCNPNVQYCDVMQSSTECQTCLTGYTLSGDKLKCTPVVSNCDVMQSATLCQICLIGHDLSSDKLTCSPSVKDCVTMVPSSATQCQTCDTGYTLGSGQLSCDPNVANCDVMQSAILCQTCLIGHTRSADQLTCSPSVSRCAVMVPASATQCQSCSVGYTLSADQLSCDANVKNCDTMQSPTECQSCLVGYTLSSDKLLCAPAVENCDVMQSALLCQNCILGYTVSADQLTCTINVANCLTMQSATECQTCLSDYVLMTNNTFCILEIENCEVISATNFTECEKCNESYVLTADKKCEAEGFTMTEVVVGTSVASIAIISAVYAVYTTFCVAVVAGGVFDEDFRRKRKEFRKKEQQEIKRLSEEQNKSIEEAEEQKKQLLKKRLRYFQNALGSS